jgi:vacuolar-type H+-ATPase subunit F/Vma7
LELAVNGQPYRDLRQFDARRRGVMAQDEHKMHPSVAIIADKYLATGFRLAGVVAFPVQSPKEASVTLQKMVAEDKYDIIIMTEKLAMALKREREAILARRKGRPVMAVIPDFEGPTGERIRELHSLISQSVGAELKFES